MNAPANPPAEFINIVPSGSIRAGSIPSGSIPSGNVPASNVRSSDRGKTGPSLAESCYPLSNPDAAKILYGFRSEDGMDPEYERTAKRAYEKDPESIEALCTLGDFAATSGQRLKWFQLACEAVKKKPRALISQEMPQVRKQMGIRLINDSLFVDAIQIMKPALDECPEDRELIRHDLAGLMLRLRWYDELESLCKRFDDPPGSILFLARVIADFAQRGANEETNQKLRLSHEMVPQATRFLSGVDPMPGLGEMVDINVHLAALMSEFLLPGVRGTEGCARWIRETLSLVENDSGNEVSPKNHPDKGLQEFTPEYGDLETALQMPTSDSTWRLVTKKQSDGVFLSVVFGEGELVFLAMLSDKPNRATLRAILLEAICAPHVGRPEKPSRVLVSTKAEFETLNNYLATIDVECLQSKLSNEEREVYDHGIEFIEKSLIANGGEQESRSSLDGDRQTMEQSLDLWNSIPPKDSPWAVGLFRPPLWIHDRSTPYRTFLLVVLDLEQGFILKTESWVEQPSDEELVEALVGAASSPSVGKPYRTSTVFIDPQSIQELQCVASLEVECFDGSEPVEKIFDELLRDLLRNASPSPESLDEQSGVSKTQLKKLYSSLAAFYRSAPWERVGSDLLLEITHESSGTSWGATVIGQLGQTTGISLIKDIERAFEFVHSQGDLSDQIFLTVQFGEAFEMLPLDFFVLERNSWSVGGEEGYPFIAKGLNTNQPSESDLCAPNLHELLLIEATARTLLTFLDQPRDSEHRFEDMQGNRYRLRWRNV